MNKYENLLSVILPVYNEENSIKNIIDEILERDETREIIIVNDASTDDSKSILEQFEHNPKIKIYHHEINQGKGAALRTAFSKATAPYVIIQDADNEYTPEDYPLLLKPFIEDKADVVYGSRFMGTPGFVRNFRHEMGNKFLTFLSNLFTDIHLSDMETCYKVFRCDVLQNINFESSRFSIEPEIAAKLSKVDNLKIYQVPISYCPRRFSEGKKIGWKDGVSAIYHIIKFNIFSDKSKWYKVDWKDIIKQ